MANLIKWHLKGLGYQPFAYHEKQGSEGFLAPFLTKLTQSAMQAGMGG